MRIDTIRGKWKSARIRIQGDLYFVRRTFDIGECGEHIYGFDVYDEENRLVGRYPGDDLAVVIHSMEAGWFPRPCISARLLHAEI